MNYIFNSALILDSGCWILVARIEYPASSPQLPPVCRNSQYFQITPKTFGDHCPGTNHAVLSCRNSLNNPGARSQQAAFANGNISRNTAARHDGATISQFYIMSNSRC